VITEEITTRSWLRCATLYFNQVAVADTARSSSDADRVERGVLINMSPDFFTRIATERDEGDK
jgi:hypothetical protein